MHELWIKCERVKSIEPIREASDDDLLEALIDSPRSLDPRYIEYLRRERYDVVNRFQQLFIADYYATGKNLIIIE